MYKADSRSAPESAQAPEAHHPDPRTRLRSIPWLTLTVIAVGGVTGALARQGLWVAFPHRIGAFDWTTLGINVGGSALIGALMTVVTEVRHTHRLTAPFLGVGVLGGFTTFSTYIVEIQQSVTARHPESGLAYLAGTVVAALLATFTGVTVTRLLSRWHRKEKS
ncbi:MAG TPA: CrcB family protein [Streptosporangiaceae bacterium]|nr:CrcB family protein [Streptosporangiaceae bacterium]